MTPDRIRLVQQSFALIGSEGQAVARLFYGRLFETDPSTKPLFRSDLEVQGAKLVTMLAMVVNGLDRLEPLLAAVEGLARRHVGYGVSERHYPSVGAALVWTLEEALGEQFTREMRAAWIEAYSILSTTMIAAAKPAVASVL